MGSNQEIISVIREHHGTSVIHFFYHRALEQRAKIEALVAEGKAEAEDVPVVQESDFRYPGPKPRSRESAIISLADAVESTSRSLAKPTPSELAEMISDITEKKLSDGQLDDCDLTLGDLTKVRKNFHFDPLRRHAPPSATSWRADRRRSESKAIDQRRRPPLAPRCSHPKPSNR